MDIDPNATRLATEDTQRNDERGFLGFKLDALLVATATLVGYAFVFAFELGFCAVYRIPSELIALTLTVALSWAAATVVFIPVLYQASPFLSNWLFQRDPDRARLFSDILLTICVLNIIIIPTQSMKWIVLAIDVAMAVVLVPLGLRLLRGKRNLGFASTPTANLIRNDVLFRMSSRARFLIASTLLVAEVSYGFGRLRAVTEPHYVVTEGVRQFLIVRIYGDDVVSVPIKTVASKTVTRVVVQPGMFVFRLGDREQSHWVPLVAGARIEPI